MSGSLWPHGLEHAWFPCPSLSPRVCSDSCPLSQWCHLPGASTGDPTRDKVTWRGLMGKASQASGVPLGFPEHLPPKTRVCLLYCTVLSTLLTFSGKKLTQGFSLLHMKGMFQLKLLWWLSNLPDRFPGFLLFVNCLQPPIRKRHKA